MREEKNTQRSTVHIGYDGRVHKVFRGPQAEERFENEVRVLKYLEKRGCPFVPRLLESDPGKLRIVTTNCGQDTLFAALEQYGVRHDDPFPRNITYDARQGQFCVIDFEFATLLEAPHLAPKPPSRD